MKEKLDNLLAAAKSEIEAARGISETENIRIKFLGKKGELTSILRGMAAVPNEQKAEVGRLINTVKAELEQLLEQKKLDAQQAKLLEKLKSESIDVTEPSVKRSRGHMHPVTSVKREITDIFLSMGFSLKNGPQIDTVYNNFDALNAPKDHPSRSKSDTFYFDSEKLLRTQTSPVQIRVMKEGRPPFRMFSIGRCFRNDSPDATHSPMFHQIEGLVVDRGVKLTDLKGTLEHFAAAMFGPETKIKFRPHYFPFTEPSGEVDVSCFKCEGKGCRFCKGSGWIEILGCGMVHPNVLKECGIDPDQYSGFAFGMGLERIAMLKHEIDDLRLIYENDLRMIRQF